MLVVEKPAGIDIEELQKFLPAGSLPSHRLDKETSGVLLVAKTTEALDFFHKQFKERKVEKKYITLVVGSIKDERGRVETLLGRAPGDRRKQKVFLPGEPGLGEKREAVSEYRVLERYKARLDSHDTSRARQDYTLLEVQPKTGRKHQIRAQFASLNHPVAGDKLYGFKDQKIPEGLKRHFLHATYLKISAPNGTVKEFSSELPEDLQNVIETINHAD